MKNTLLTKRELARYLNKTCRFVTHLTKTGKIPCFELGPHSHCYILESVLKALEKPVEAGKGGIE